MLSLSLSLSVDNITSSSVNALVFSPLLTLTFAGHVLHYCDSMCRPFMWPSFAFLNISTIVDATILLQVSAGWVFKFLYMVYEKHVI